MALADCQSFEGRVLVQLPIAELLRLKKGSKISTKVDCCYQNCILGIVLALALKYQSAQAETTLLNLHPEAVEKELRINSQRRTSSYLGAHTDRMRFHPPLLLPLSSSHQQL